MSEHLTFVRCDDWIGVYRGDTLAYQHHSVSPQVLLDIVGVSYDVEDVDQSEQAVTYLEIHGTLPDSLQEARRLLGLE